MSLYKLRVKKVQIALKEKGLDALVVFPGVNYRYFMGFFKIGVLERLLTTIIPTDGKPISVTPKFEEELVRIKSKLTVEDIRTWREDQDPYAVFAKALKDLGIADGKVGLDGDFPYHFVYRMQKAIPQAEFELADDVIYSLRSIKSREELDIMKKACSIVGKGIKAAHEYVAEGRKEIEVFQELQSEIRRAGGGPAVGIVTSGKITALVHEISSDKAIRKGDMLLIDALAPYQGYYGDLTRMAVLGRATSKMKKVYDIVLKAQKAAINRVKAGIEAQEVDRTARKIISDAGYGPNFTHRLGHGLGLEIHEDPYLVEGNTLKLRPGMCHSVEPGVYLSNEWGIRIEDDVTVTEDGCEVLSKGVYPKEELLVI